MTQHRAANAGLCWRLEVNTPAEVKLAS